MSLKARIEAILFMSEKPTRAAAIARLVNEDVQEVRKVILELIHDYEERQGGLEIGQDDGYIIQVKEEYSDLAEEMAPMEMSAALLRTLAAIAIRQPVMQSDIIRIRGAGAYEHVKQLVEQKLVIKKNEDSGRSPNLSTTRRFQEYFRLSKDGTDWRKYFKQQEAIMRKHEEEDADRKAAEEEARKAAEEAEKAGGQLDLPLKTSRDTAAAVPVTVESSPDLKDTAAEPVDLSDQEDNLDETEGIDETAREFGEVQPGSAEIRKSDSEAPAASEEVPEFELQPSLEDSGEIMGAVEDGQSEESVAPGKVPDVQATNAGGETIA